MHDEHRKAVNGLARKVAEMIEMASDSRDAMIADNAIKVGAQYLPTKEIEQYEAAVANAGKAIEVLNRVAGSSIIGVAANDSIHSQPVFNADHAQNWNHRPGYESLVKDHSKDSSNS